MGLRGANLPKPEKQEGERGWSTEVWYGGPRLRGASQRAGNKAVKGEASLK